MNNERLLPYIRSELESLAETYDEQDAMSRINRFKGQVDMLLFTGAITKNEAEKLYDELQTARSQAEKNIKSDS